MPTKFYITTTIPYVNAPPHLGHALEFVQADVIARSRRAAKDEVYFLSGTDDNAIKNVQAAESAGVPADEFVSRNSETFKRLLAALNISTDQFIRTTEERHKVGAQALWAATKPEDIYKKTYEGLYCTGCELFYKPEELNEKGECLEHPGRKLELVKEENYFFKLSKYGTWLHELVEGGEMEIVPDSRKNEVLAFIDRGLEDFSISRPVSRSKGWGVPVPGDPSQTIYVWYDALANYITALGYPDVNAQLYRTFWSENKHNRLHVLGKGVSRFHAIYWPAMLKSAGLPVPTKEFIHGYITVNGEKISKTLGNVVDPFAVVQKYGVDAVRYYLLREIPAYDDGDFGDEEFKNRYNSDLANGLGNFAARVLTLGAGLGKIPEGLKPDAEISGYIEKTKKAVSEKTEDFKFHEALAAIWDLLSFGDSYVNKTAPWGIKDSKEKVQTVFNLVVILDNVAALLRPFLPGTAEKITGCINWDGELRVEKGKILFPRI